MNPRRCVIVPTFDRSELLAVCLEHIRAASSDIEIHVWPDRGTDERVVCAAHAAIHHFTISHTYHGNSFVMLESLRWAHQHRYDTVYIIEDDCFIAPDFFRWADAALAAHPDAFAACGWQYSPDAMPPSDGPNLSMPWYLSVCAALPKHSIAHMSQHARPEYYADMRGYLDALFPSSIRRGTRHFEQDGLALRILESQSRTCWWPRRPRATHAGWWGYHMPSGARPTGTLDERIRIVRLLAANPSLLSSLLNGGAAPDIAYCASCRKPLLTLSPAAILRCVDCYHRDHPNRPRVSSSHYYFPAPPLAPPNNLQAVAGVSLA